MLGQRLLTRWLLAAAAVTMFLSLCAPSGAWEPARLDASFGEEGRVSLPYLGTSISRVRVASDGAVFLSSSGAGYLQRLTSNGAVDYDWVSEAGVGISDFVIAPDKSMYVLSPGTEYGESADLVTKLLPSGKRDLSFGISGRVDLRGLIPTFAGREIVLLNGNRIVIGGSAPIAGEVWRRNGALIALKLDGTADSGYGTDGISILDAAPTVFSARALAARPDGSLLVGGIAAEAGRWSRIIAVDSSGQRIPDDDTGFHASATDGQVDRIAVGPDGSFIVSYNGIEDPRSGGGMYHSYAQFAPQGGTRYGYASGVSDAISADANSAWIVSPQASPNRFGAPPGGWGYSTVPSAVFPLANPVERRVPFGESGRVRQLVAMPDGSILMAGEVCTDTCRAMVMKTLPAGGGKEALGARFTWPAKVGPTGLKRIRGSAYPADRVKRVSVAILRVSAADRKRGVCRWVRAGFTKYRRLPATEKSREASCPRAHWLKASGASRWQIRSKRALAPGTYQVRVRAYGTDGKQTNYMNGSDFVQLIYVTRKK